MLDRVPPQFVSDIFGLVCGLLHLGVDVSPFDQVDQVLRVVEQFDQPGTQQRVGLVLQAVDLDDRGEYLVQFGTFAQVLYSLRHFLCAPDYALGQFLCDRRYRLDLVHGHHVAGRVNIVGHVVYGAIELDDVFAVERSDEGLVKLLVDAVADLVAAVLVLVQARDRGGRVLVAAEIVTQVAQLEGGLVRIARGVFEPLEEVAVFLLEEIKQAHGRVPLFWLC
jgi:hypothetical protein